MSHKSAYDKSAPSKFALLKMAPLKQAPLIFEQEKFAYVKFAFTKTESDKSQLDITEPCKLALANFMRARLDSASFTPHKSRPFKFAFDKSDLFKELSGMIFLDIRRRNLRLAKYRHNLVNIFSRQPFGKLKFVTKH